MGKTLIFTATYNEAENIDKFLRRSFNLELDCRNAGSTNIKIPSM